MTYLLALDQGTSSSRSIVFDANGRIVALAQQELSQIYPQPGWVEHDPVEIWEAALATLTEVLTPEAYVHFARIGTKLAEGLRASIDKYGIPANIIDLGCKGCVTYRPEPLTCYRDFLETNTDLYLASYPWMINRQVFMTPGDEEQWLSLIHI